LGKGCVWMAELVTARLCESAHGANKQAAVKRRISAAQLFLEMVIT